MFNKASYFAYKALLSQASKTLTLFALTGLFSVTVVRPGLSSCAPRSSFPGHWYSTWYASNGQRFSSPLDLNTLPNGISGQYTNGVLNGSYVNGDRRFVTGYWQRTQGDSGGPCQYGRFAFRLANGQILGRWSYCNDEPLWQWKAGGTCDDSMLPTTPSIYQAMDKRSLPLAF